MSHQLILSQRKDIERLHREMDNAIDKVKSEIKAQSFWGDLYNLWNQIKQIVADHPELCKFILITTAGVITIPLLLQIAGFTATGVAAESFAAAWQSWIGDVAAKSLFASLQSWGMQPGLAAATGGFIAVEGYIWFELIRIVERADE